MQPISDFREYHLHAVTLADHGVYGDGQSAPDAYWEPGWPLLLGVVYFVFGAHPRLGAVLGGTLDWAAIVLAAVAACRLLRPAFAAGAVAAMSLYPAGIAYSPVLGTEHLAAPLFTAAVVLLALRRPSPATVAGVGLLGGTLLLVRPELAIALAPVAAVWVAREAPAGRAIAFAAVGLAAALVCVSPWVIRNAHKYGEFIPTSTKGGLTFYLATLSPRFTEPPIVERLGVTSSTKPAAHDRMWLRKGLRNVRDDPLRWLAFDVRRLYYQYGKEDLLLHWGEVRSPVERGVARAYWLAVVALGLAGFGALIALRRRLDPGWWYIAGSILAVTLLKTVFVVNQRDRLPLTCLLMVLAGLGAQQLWATGWLRRTCPDKGSAGAPTESLP